MARIKGGTHTTRQRKKILSRTKGYRFNLSKKKRAAREALYHAERHAFDHRRDKKGDFRRLWTTRINAAIRAHGMSYSVFIKALKDRGVAIDRKVLATLAKDKPEAFARVVKEVK